MIAHHVRHILGTNLTRRLYKQRHFSLQVIPHGIVNPVRSGTGDFPAIFHVCKRSVSEDIESAPCPGITSAGSAEIKRIECISETEILIPAFEPSFLAGKRNHIRSIKTVFRVVKRESRDSSLIGMRTNISVRNTPCHPDNSLAVRSLAHEVHHPGLFGVSDGESLPFRHISVFIGETDDDTNGLTRRLGTLKSHIYQ